MSLIQPNEMIRTDLKTEILRYLYKRLETLWFLKGYEVNEAIHSDSVYLHLAYDFKNMLGTTVSIRNHKPNEKSNGYIYVYLSDFDTVKDACDYTIACICLVYNNNQRTLDLRCDADCLSGINTKAIGLKRNLEIYYHYNKFEDMLNNFRHASAIANKTKYRFVS